MKKPKNGTESWKGRPDVRARPLIKSREYDRDAAWDGLPVPAYVARRASACVRMPLYARSQTSSHEDSRSRPREQFLDQR